MKRSLLSAALPSFVQPFQPPPLVDPLLTAKESADFLNVCLAAFWRGVAAKRFPAPVYPASRSPRWYASELRQALEATRALPAEAKAQRRAARILAAAE